MNTYINRPLHLRRMQDLARLLDTTFRLPLGIRVGWDAVLGFVPILGSAVTNFASFFIVYQSAAMGCPPAVLVRMGLNIMVDNLIDMVPFFGNFFDIFWRANKKNVALAEAYVDAPARVAKSSRWVVTLTLIAVALLLITLVGLTAYLAFETLKVLYSMVARSPGSY